MNKTLILLSSIGGIFLVGGLLIVGAVISTLNKEADIRVTINAKQEDNKNEMDGMWKTIAQTAQVTDAQKKALIEIFNGYAAARTGANKGGSLANWIHEAVPNVDTSTFNNLQNIITAKRDGFVMRQKELLDLSREHNRLLQRFPSGMICSVFGREALKITIVTSTRTEESFETGKDDNVSVFEN